MTEETQALLPVTQADRDEAAKFLRGVYGEHAFDSLWAPTIERGAADWHAIVRLVAAVRQSHSLPGEAWVQEVSGILKAVIPSLEEKSPLRDRIAAALTPSPCPGDGMREASVLPVHPIDMLREMLAREIARTSTTESFMIRSGLLADLLDELVSFRQLHSLPAEPVSLAEKILWHVEQVCGPLSTETVENPGDDDRSVLSHNIRAVLTPSALSGQSNHQFVQNPVMPFSSCQICLAPADVHAARQGSE